MDTLFKKCYKSNLKNITYKTLEKGHPFFTRVKYLINEKNQNKEKYDLYFFMRIDCIFSKKINISNLTNKLNDNIVKLICSNNVFKKRLDHNRDWDFGIYSKNIDNILKYMTSNYDKILPNNYELKIMSKTIKCINIFSRYKLPLPKKIERKYKNNWHYNFNSNIYSFNKNVAPLWFEDNFFLTILR